MSVYEKIEVTGDFVRERGLFEQGLVERIRDMWRWGYNEGRLTR